MIPLENENIRQFIRKWNRAISELASDPIGFSEEYLWGADFILRMLARTWAGEVKARRRQEK